jgi:hypothetical protein
MANRDIIQELSDLGSSLAALNPVNVFSVPEGYFEGFSDRVLAMIKNQDDLSLLPGLPKVNPFKVPEDYFNGLEERIMDTIRNHPDYQTSTEELQSISPLLSSLRKRPVYSVPEGYFENFNVPGDQKKNQPKVISITSHKWFRYAAAAVVIVAISLTGFFVYKNNHADPAQKTIAKLQKDVKKIDDVKKTDSLIDFMEDGLNQKQIASNQPLAKVDDVQKLLQDVSTDELKAFNDQTKDIEDLMMIN